MASRLELDRVTGIAQLNTSEVLLRIEGQHLDSKTVKARLLAEEDGKIYFVRKVRGNNLVGIGKLDSRLEGRSFNLSPFSRFDKW